MAVVLIGTGIAALNVPFYLARQAYLALDPAAPPTFRVESVQRMMLLKEEASRISQSSHQQREVLERMEQQLSVEAGSAMGRQRIKEWAGQLRAHRESRRPVHVTAPPNIAELMRPGLETEGFVLHDTPCKACIRLTWREGSGWGFVAPPEMDADMVASSLRLAALQAAEDAKEERPVVLMAPEDLGRDTVVLGRRFLDGVVHATLVIIAWFMMWGASFVGLTWDKNRSRGSLEPWVTAHQPPWVLFLSQIGRAAIWMMGTFAAICAAAWAWGLPLRWNLVGALLLFVPIGIVMVGLWGMLATVLFHHRRGRMFSRFVLSPFVWIVVWFIRVGVLWVALQSTNPIQANAIVVWGLEKGHWPVLMALPAMGVLCVVLLGLVNWRIGPRREGLRMSK